MGSGKEYRPPLTDAQRKQARDHLAQWKLLIGMLSRWDEAAGPAADRLKDATAATDELVPAYKQELAIVRHSQEKVLAVVLNIMRGRRGLVRKLDLAIRDLHIRDAVDAIERLLQQPREDPAIRAFRPIDGRNVIDHVRMIVAMEKGLGNLGRAVPTREKVRTELRQYLKSPPALPAGRQRGGALLKACAILAKLVRSPGMQQIERIVRAHRAMGLQSPNKAKRGRRQRGRSSPRSE